VNTPKRRQTAQVLIVTGLPAAGKTTLAMLLARRWSVPFLGKDLIKEPLLDVLGATDASAARRLSDASFAILFALARELVAAGASLVLEGNFRPAEHAPAARALSRTAKCAQVLSLRGTGKNSASPRACFGCESSRGASRRRAGSEREPPDRIPEFSRRAVSVHRHGSTRVAPAPRASGSMVDRRRSARSGPLNPCGARRAFIER